MIYLTTNLQLDHSNFLNSAANTVLSPVNYWLDGRSVRIVENAIQNIPKAPDTSWLRTAFMVAALIPSLIVGSAIRLVSLLDSQIKRGFTVLQTPPAPPPIDPNHLPVGSVVDKNIAYLKKLIDQPDNTLKTWLEANDTGVDYRDVLEGSSVLESTREVFVHDLTSEQLSQLTELCGQAIQKLQKNGLLDSVQVVVEEAPKSTPTPPKPKPVREPDYIAPNTFKLLYGTYSKLSDTDFAKLSGDPSFIHLCKELKIEPEIVLKKISDKKKAATIHSIKDKLIIFYLDFMKIPDQRVVNLEPSEKKSLISALSWSAKVTSHEEAGFYKATLGGQYFEDISSKHAEVQARLNKLRITL